MTENGDGPGPAGTLYVGIDVGRRSHMVTGIPRLRMEDGSWERVAARRFASSGGGYRELTAWLATSGLDPKQIQIGLEPTGGWYSQTVAAWLVRRGYQISWLQNAALHERRRLATGRTQSSSSTPCCLAMPLGASFIGVRTAGPELGRTRARLRSASTNECRIV